MNSSSNRALFFIALGLFGVFTVEFSVIGLLPSIVSRYEVTVAQAGWLVGWFAAFAAVGGPFMVLWLSRYDRRRVLISSLAVFAVCSAASAWAPNFATLMLLRIPSALLLSVFFSMAFAAAVALYPPNRAAHAMSMALMGESIGLVFGVPLITFIEARVSYESAFLFCALVCALAVVGLWRLPATGNAAQDNTGKQALVVLKKPTLWLGLLATAAILAAMFSLYSYATEYLSKIGLSREAISLLMTLFGVGGLLGNFITGRTLAWDMRTTVIIYPMVMALAYLALYLFASPVILTMGVLCIVWGAAHTSGAVVSQFWISSSAKEAPEFATSLFVSAANVGVTIGATVGGLFINWIGMNGPVWSGWIFAAIALCCFLASMASAPSSTTQPRATYE